MKINIIETVNINLSKEEKEVLINIYKIIKKIKNINLDSNTAMEELDTIQKSNSIKKFIESFSMLEESKEKKND